MQSGFTGAGRKQFIALTSLVKIWTNCKRRLSHKDVKDVKQASHIAAAGCVSACVCIKLSEIGHVIPFVHISPCTPCAIADLFPYLVQAWLCRHLVRSQPGTSCSPEVPKPSQPGQHSQTRATSTSYTASHRTKHPNRVASVAQTPLPPPSAEVRRRTQRKSA